jgi:hypothetical protein
VAARAECFAFSDTIWVRRASDRVLAPFMKKFVCKWRLSVAKGSNGQIVVRAVKTRQGKDVDVFAFFLFGSDLVRIADISRIARDEGELKGFQRKEIRSHVNSIAAFLDSGPVLFPNAIILALSPEIEFKNSRGTRSSQAGH